MDIHASSPYVILLIRDCVDACDRLQMYGSYKFVKSPLFITVDHCYYIWIDIIGINASQTLVNGYHSERSSVPADSIRA